ncbi:MAG: flippase-like domain-containing protein [Gammaproteobacteria bacterium]|nr:flippase-like domain-containing protein [Gammaproteobacteria bacterium]
MLKKFLILCLKLTLAFTLLYWLYDSDALDLGVFRQLEFDSRTTWLLGLNAVLLFTGAILLSLRMWRLLNLLDFDVSVMEAIRVNLASMCLGLMLPGLLGVDAIRAIYFCLKTRDRKVDAFTCILADRLIGIYALILLAAIAAVIGMLIDLQSINKGFVAVSGGGLLALTVVIVLMSSKRVLEQGPLSIIYKRFPAVLRRIVEAVQQLAGFRRDVGLCLLITVISQSITIINFVIIGILINDNLPLLAHFILDPIALFFNSVPITPGGLGITESVFAYLYDSAGSDNGALVSLLGRLNQYCVYIIIGLPAFFLLKLNFAALGADAKQDR